MSLKFWCVNNSLVQYPCPWNYKPQRPKDCSVREPDSNLLHQVSWLLLTPEVWDAVLWLMSLEVWITFEALCLRKKFRAALGMQRAQDSRRTVELDQS